MHGGFAGVTMEECVHEIDIFTSATGNFNITTFKHMKTKKNNAIVGNTGHFDNEIGIVFPRVSRASSSRPSCLSLNSACSLMVTVWSSWPAAVS